MARHDGPRRPKVPAPPAPPPQPEHHEPEEAPDQAYWDELAHDVRRHLRTVRHAHRREQQKSMAFYAYVVALFAAFYIAPYTGGLLQLAEHTGVVAPLADRLTPALPAAATGVVLLVLLTAVTDGLWRGPVVVDAPTTGWVVPAPAAWGLLLRARLRISLVAYVAGGMLAALALGFLAQIGARARVTAMLVPVAATGVALGVLAVGVGTLVERHDTVVRRHAALLGVLRGVAVTVAGLAALAVWRPDALPRLLGTILLWSGPWGWAAQPLVAAADDGRAQLWPVGLALTLTVAAIAYWQASGALPALSGPVLRARVGSSRGVFAALMAGDLRQATLTVRSATAARRRSPRVSLPAPKRPSLIVAWRVLLGWLRSPGRLGWSALALAVAYSAVALAARVQGWERALTAGVGVLVAYVAAGALLEAARVEADDVRPSRSLPMPFSDLMLMHGVAPLALLLGEGAVAVGVAALSGGEPAAAGGLLLGSPVLVAAGLISACRGPLSVKAMVGNESAVGNTALVGIVFWYGRAPLATLVLVLPAVLLGAAGGLPSGLLGYEMLGLVAMWYWVRRAADGHYGR